MPNVFKRKRSTHGSRRKARRVGSRKTSAKRSFVRSRKASVRSVFQSKSKKFSKKKASRFGGAVKRRRLPGGGVGVGGSGARGLVSFYRKRAAGGKRGPLDQYVHTGITLAATIDANSSDVVCGHNWGGGNDVGTMLTQIRAESPFSLVGGAYLYQPTLIVRGFSVLDIVATGNSALNVEVVVFTTRRNNINTPANELTNWNNAWSQSFDARPTGYEAFPSTSLLENYKYWDNSSATANWPTRHVRAVVKVGKPWRMVSKYKTRVYRYEDYSQSTFLTEGMATFRTHYHMIKLSGERGQLCGVLDATTNQPILNEVSAMYMLRTRSFYYYRWVPGNNRPSIYGAYLGDDETVANDALGWIGVPALKSQRLAGSTAVAAGYPNWGATGTFTKHEANINSIVDCTGDPQIPSVILGA